MHLQRKPLAYTRNMISQGMAQAFCVSQFGRVGDPQVELLVIARCLLGVAGQQ